MVNPPSSGYINSRVNLPQVSKIKNLVINREFVILDVLLQQTVCSILVLLLLRLPSVHGISFLL